MAKKALPVMAVLDGILKIHKEVRLTKQAQGNSSRAERRLQISEENHEIKQKRYFGRIIK